MLQEHELLKASGRCHSCSQTAAGGEMDRGAGSAHQPIWPSNRHYKRRRRDKGVAEWIRLETDGRSWELAGYYQGAAGMAGDKKEKLVWCWWAWWNTRNYGLWMVEWLWVMSQDILLWQMWIKKSTFQSFFLFTAFLLRLRFKYPGYIIKTNNVIVTNIYSFKLIYV